MVDDDESTCVGCVSRSLTRRPFGGGRSDGFCCKKHWSIHPNLSVMLDGKSMHGLCQGLQRLKFNHPNMLGGGVSARKQRHRRHRKSSRDIDLPHIACVRSERLAMVSAINMLLHSISSYAHASIPATMVRLIDGINNRGRHIHFRRLDLGRLGRFAPQGFAPSSSTFNDYRYQWYMLKHVNR